MNNQNNFRYRIAIGDWRQEGHNRFTYYDILSSFDIAQFKQIYENTKDKIGFSLIEEFKYSNYLEPEKVKSLADYLGMSRKDMAIWVDWYDEDLVEALIVLLNKSKDELGMEGHFKREKEVEMENYLNNFLFENEEENIGYGFFNNHWDEDE